MLRLLVSAAPLELKAQVPPSPTLLSEPGFAPIVGDDWFYCGRWSRRGSETGLRGIVAISGLIVGERPDREAREDCTG